MQNGHSQKVHIALFLIILLLTGDVVYLNYQALTKATSENQTESQPKVNEQIIASESAKLDSCYPDSCIDLIREATASLLTKTTSSKPSTVSSSAKEYYIPFGSGQTMSVEWEDVSGLAISIDSTKYGRIKQVTFEVSMRVPTGNGQGYVQLFNATDKHPVWFSEVTNKPDTSVSQLLVSQPITLDEGNKLYKVQMKTSLGYLTVLESARVHILTE